MAGFADAFDAFGGLRISSFSYGIIGLRTDALAGKSRICEMI
jgi:hypothetical protein